MKTYDEIIQAIETALREHNAGLRDKSKAVDVDAAVGATLADGATLAALQHLTEQDFKGYGFPTGVARLAVRLATGLATTSAPDAPPAIEVTLKDPLAETRAASVPELLDKYDPAAPTSLVGLELAQRAGGKAFLLFGRDGRLDRTKSAAYLDLILRNVPVDDLPTVDGVPTRPRAVGEPITKPEPFKENPLYRRHPLRAPGEVCHVTGESWEGVSPDVRVLIAVAGQVGDLAIGDNKEEARRVIGAARQPNALETLRRRWRRAALRVCEMSPRDLPSLELDPAAVVEGGRGAPFAGDAPSVMPKRKDIDAARQPLRVNADVWPSSRACRVVIWGAPEDAEYIRAIEQATRILVRTGMAVVWTPSMMAPGGDIALETADRIDGAEIAVVVTSADFWGLLPHPVVDNLERRASDGLRVVPVVARPSVGDPGSWLSHLQALPQRVGCDGAVPISRWRDPDDALTEVARGLRAVVVQAVGHRR